VPGVTTGELDRIVEKYLDSVDASSALKGYRGFPKVICTSVNNVAAHGIPDQYRLETGDILSVDLTIVKDGWHGDGAWTYVVSKTSADTERLLRGAWQASLAGVLAVTAGGAVGDLGYAISRTARKNGCSVVKDYVGHGIGEDLHEEPRIPNIGQKGQGQRIVPGMVFTVEPIVTLGKGKVKLLDDNWTVITSDGSLAAQFEHTVAVFKDRTEILTLAGFDVRDHLHEVPFF
jgi:methionyl aminopeptidase